MLDRRPVLCVVAGPNGSGKTSATIQLLSNEWAADALYIKRAAEGTRKAQGVVAQVLAKNSLDEIDVVSGATCSSSALLEACRQALESAKIVQQSE